MRWRVLLFYELTLSLSPSTPSSLAILHSSDIKKLLGIEREDSRSELDRLSFRRCLICFFILLVGH
jgi:hypothetical protein